MNKFFWKGRKVFITGHTGFKGAWLSIFLKTLGAQITGYSLKPSKKSLYNLAKVQSIISRSYFADIKDFDKLNKAIKNSKAEIIFHLAAQPLVLESYANPRNTFETNINGTLNIIESAKKIKEIRSIIIITTDKVYDVKKNKIFKESDLLGGNDPYSMSKVCSELIAESYSKSFKIFSKKVLVTARAGNVIGGGDFSKDRIIPDIIRSYEHKKPLQIRNPNHIRPWQHVLEPLAGYLLLAEKTFKKKLPYEMENWNFGPDLQDCKSVKFIINQFKKRIPLTYKKLIVRNKKKETKSLRLDNSKSKKYLHWKPKWKLNDTIDKIIEWNNLIKTQNVLDVCIKQVFDYLKK